MSEKRGGRKLGRNPFDHKKPSQHRHRERKDNQASGPPEPAAERIPEPRDLQGDVDPSGSSVAANPAWFFVDLWTGILTEPYFFWKKIGDATLNRRF